MLDETSGTLKILDFGVARLDTSQLTQTGTVFGTPSYMSPEQVLGRKVDARSDLFSLGAVFYEMLTGHKAFGGDHLATIAYRIINEPPEDIDKIPQRIGEGFEYVLSRALAKAPKDRFGSAEEFADAIRTYCLGDAAAPDAPAPASVTPRTLASDVGVRRSLPLDRRTAALAVLVVAAIVTGIGAWSFFGGSRSASRAPTGGLRPGAIAADTTTEPSTESSTEPSTETPRHSAPSPAPSGLVLRHRAVARGGDDRRLGDERGRRHDVVEPWSSHNSGLRHRSGGGRHDRRRRGG